jgi:hypothetical protein
MLAVLPLRQPRALGWLVWQLNGQFVVQLKRNEYGGRKVTHDWKLENRYTEIMMLP